MTGLRWGAATDVGRVRNNNEDSMLVAPDLFAIADGMGGHKGGEVASRMALEVLRTSFGQPTVVALVEAAEQANREVYGAAGDEPELRGMGTTLVAIAPIGETGELGWINIGDSRLYLLRDGDMSKLSVDHSLVEDMVRDGRISEAEARTHPKRNIVTRALGISPHVDVDPGTVVPHLFDRYLLCSDGLYDVVEDDQIASVLRRLGDPGDTARELVRLANEGGGRDNITVVVLDVVDDDRSATGAGTGAVGAVGAAGAAAAATTIVGGGEGHAEFNHLFASPPPDRSAPPRARAGQPQDRGPQQPDSTGRLAVVANPGHAPAWSTGERDDDTAALGSAQPKESRRERRARKAESRPPRRITWRVLLFLLLFGGIIGAGIYAVNYEARRTYYVGFDGDEVTVFRGRPGGTLWIEPSAEEHTGITRADVPPARLTQVDEGKQTDSREAADTFVAELRNQIAELDVPSTTTTTTPTTVPPTTAGPVFPGPTLPTPA